MANSKKVGSCLSCTHLIFIDQDGIKIPSTRCKAFPQGIPIDILHGTVSHAEPYEGDNGIQYEKHVVKNKFGVVLNKL